MGSSTFWRGIGLAATAAVMLGQAAQPGPAGPRQEEATAEQVNEAAALYGKLTEAQLGDVAVAEDAKAEHWTQRERWAWVVGEYKRIAQANAKNPPAVESATGLFGSVIQDIRFISPAAGVAATNLGVVVTQGSLDRWKGVTPWDRAHGLMRIVGATETGCFLTTTDFRGKVMVKQGDAPPPGAEDYVTTYNEMREGKRYFAHEGYTNTLWRWTAAEGLKEVRKMAYGQPDPGRPTACAFANDRVGAFVDGQKLAVTLDGGGTWVETALKPAPGQRILRVYEVAFCGEDRVAVMMTGDAGTDVVALLRIDKAGHVQEAWRSPASGRYPAMFMPHTLAFDSARKVVWAFTEGWGMAPTSKLQAFRLEDGASVRQFSPLDDNEWLHSYSFSHDRMYAVLNGPQGGEVVRMWDLARQEPQRIGQINGPHGNNSGISSALPAPDGEDLYLVIAQGRLIRWDGKPVLQPYLPSTIRRTAVDTAAFAGVEDRWPPGDSPSRREEEARAAAQRALTQDQNSQLLAELSDRTRRVEFANFRQQVLWTTKRALEIKAGIPLTQSAVR